MAGRPKEIFNPGELSRTRKNLGDLSPEEAKRMAEILGGEVGIERTDDAIQKDINNWLIRIEESMIPRLTITHQETDLLKRQNIRYRKLEQKRLKMSDNPTLKKSRSLSELLKVSSGSRLYQI